MIKTLKWAWNNILFLCTVFLLAFIPLYPKLPLLDIKNTWVYVRAEDFLVLVVIFIWLVFLIRKKVTLKTPLTIPIFAFWIIGAIATIHGIIIIFPTTANIFPNVAFLEYLRHIEYVSLFFVAYAGMRDKRFLPVFLGALMATLFGIVLYGLGQKYLSFPAYLTMNEEFAKGVPIQLSALSRVPSTFAGHYDLAAYLVLVVPIMASLFFGFKKRLIKIFLVVLVVLGFILMFMTVSRVSFIVLLFGILIVLLFQKKKIVILSLPILLLVFIVLLGLKSSLLQRFSNTVKEVDVMVDGKTGAAIGNVSYVPVKYFFDKNVKIRRVSDTEALEQAIVGKSDQIDEATSSSKVPFYMLIPPETQVPLVSASNVSTGETLPQGTGYINLSLSPVSSRVGNFFYGISLNTATTSAQVINFHGDFIIKKADAYDLSFTTRFQGEWPHAIEAFERNVAIGSGYGSVSLAVDNNFLRILGEIGLLGMAAFLSIFLVVGIWIKKTFSSIDSKLAKSLLVGYCAGVIGLMLNAILIDVFEASKVAFTLFLLTGGVMGTIHVYSQKRIELYPQLKKVAWSSYSIIVYMLLVTIAIFSRSLPNYFLGQDFTWFRYASLCKRGEECLGTAQVMLSYVTHIADPLYSPATKLYFYLMYTVFWLNQDVYHLVSVSLHVICAVLFFLIAGKILKNKFLSALAAFLFLVVSGYSEAVFSISSTGYLFGSVFVLLGLLSYMLYEEKKRLWYFLITLGCIVAALLFNQIGIVLPILLVVYQAVYEEVKIIRIFSQGKTIVLFAPVIVYLVIRLGAFLSFIQSQPLVSLPFTAVNNAAGYFFLSVFGGMSEVLYKLLQGHMIVSGAFVIVVAVAVFLIYQSKMLQLAKFEGRVAVFGGLLFLSSLLPFILIPGLYGTYSYLPTMGVLLLLMLCVKRVYTYLETQGRDIAYMSLAILILAFSLLHIIQFQQSLQDVRTNGEKVRSFYISIDDSYANNWSTGNVDLYFVNVPQGGADAQVLPSILNDVLWFAFQNRNLNTKSYTDVEQALQDAKAKPSTRVFQFNDDGSVREIRVLRP